MKNILKIAEMVDHCPSWLKDAFHHVAKDSGLKTDDLELHRHSHSEKSKTDQINPSKRQSLKYVSARTQDRDDEIVIPRAIDLKEFKKYAHVLVNHNYSLLPVGSDETIEADDFGIKALTNHADTGEGTLANVIWHLVSQGHMKSSSVGFVPTSFTKPGARDWDTVANKLQSSWKEFDKGRAEKSISRIITGGVLLEHSFVSVPCNADAEMISVVKGMVSDDAVLKQLGWEKALVKKAEEEEAEAVPCVCGKCGAKRECAVGEACAEDGCDGKMKSLSEEKSVVCIVSKGDEEGHEFRGNQYTSGGYGGSAGGRGTSAEQRARQEEYDRAKRGGGKRGDEGYNTGAQRSRDGDYKVGARVATHNGDYATVVGFDKDGSFALARIDGGKVRSFHNSDLQPVDEDGDAIQGGKKKKSLKAEGMEEGSDEDSTEDRDGDLEMCECSTCGTKRKCKPDIGCAEEGCKGTMVPAVEEKQMVVKVVKAASSIKVLYTPPDEAVVAKGISEAVERALNRRLGKVG